MISGFSITHGSVRTLTRWGGWVTLLAVSLTVYALFGRPRPTVPAPSPFPVVPQLAPVYVRKGIEPYSYYGGGRNLFAYRPLSNPAPFPVVVPKPAAPPPPPPPPPPDTHGLSVTGVVRHSRIGNYVLLRDDASAVDRMVSVGDQVRNARVIEITDAGMVLETKQQVKATLTLPQVDAALGAIQSSPSASMLSTHYVAPSGPTLGISVRAASAKELSDAGVKDGVYVDHVRTGSPVQVGDILIKMGGQSTPTVARAVSIYKKNRTAKTLELTVMRSGKPFTLHLTFAGD